MSRSLFGVNRGIIVLYAKLVILYLGPMTQRRQEHRNVAVLAYDQVQVLDVTGPLEVFDKANGHLPAPHYRSFVVAPRGGALQTSGPAKLHVDRTIDDVSTKELAGLDTLVVAGGCGVMAARKNPHIIAFVRRAAARARRVVSVCSGTFLLAEAGLLQGRRATTHWESLDLLAAQFPRILVERDAIYVRDGTIWTSAGVTTGIDLTLALVEEDLGREVALAAARDLVVYMQRPGGQAQFSRLLPARRPNDRRLDSLVAWIEQNPAANLSITALARRCAMSERNFARRFVEQTGVSPARFVEQRRLDFCRQRLERQDITLEQLAQDSGLKSPEVLRRLFQRHLGISPSAYRERFRTAAR